MLSFIQRHLWRLVAVLIIAAAAAYFFIFSAPTTPKTAQSGLGGSSVNVNYESLGDVVFPVEIDTVRRGTLVQYITANGAVRPVQSVDIVARTSGFVDAAPPANGTAVAKGQTVVHFDTREALLALKEAEDKRIQAQVEFGLSFREPADTAAAARAQARARQEQVASTTKLIQAQLAEADSLFKAGRLSAKEHTERRNMLEAELLYSGAQRTTVMQSKSGLSAAINAVEKARLMLEYCTMRAPFAGIVANASVAVGQYVQAGQTLCKVVDASSLLVDVGVLETELPFVRVGTDAEVRFQALPETVVRGVVVAINPLADPSSKTYTVTLRLQTTTVGGKRIAPGMFATVRLVAQELRNRLLLPKAALLSRDKRNVVFSLAGTSDKPTAQWNYVETGAANDRYVEITSGLEAGAVVMTEGHFTLAHGAAVQVQSRVRAQAAKP
jgi:RND family efflux transporter MFP subunit